MKGQASLEFAMMMAFATLFVTAMFLFAYAALHESGGKQQELKINRLADSVQEEIILASTMHDGYATTVSLPGTLDTIQYDVVHQNTTLTFIYGAKEIHRSIPAIQGTVRIGELSLQKQNGVVIIS